MKNILFSCMLIMLVGCGTQQHASKLDGKKLAEQKCVKCHNLDMPPKTSDKELAPPLYTVTVHLKDWMKVDNPSELRGKFTSFVESYVVNPERDRSYCNKESLDTYGLMPSQKGNVTEDELEAIAHYIFDTYDQMKMLEILQEKAKIEALPPAQQVLATKDCKMCHIAAAGKIAPSFAQIGKKYAKQGVDPVKQAIVHGSKGKWPQYTIPMRAYTDLTPKQLEGIAHYILSCECDHNRTK
jgi:cytochrome c